LIFPQDNKKKRFPLFFYLVKGGKMQTRNGKQKSQNWFFSIPFVKVKFLGCVIKDIILTFFCKTLL